MSECLTALCCMRPLCCLTPHHTTPFLSCFLVHARSCAPLRAQNLDQCLHAAGLARDSGYAEESPLPRDFQHHIRFTDYSCGAVKINCAVDRLPNFECFPSPADGVRSDEIHASFAPCL